MPFVTSDDTWVQYPVPRPEASARLFCFPYAGAGEPAYREFAEELPARIEVAAVRLPAPADRMDVLVTELAEALGPHLTKPFAFFGHSMGAHVAFELARHLAQEGLAGPDRLLVSGCPAPHAPRGDERDHLLPDDLDTGLLRADLILAQTYEYRPGPPLQVPIHAFLGSDDPIAGNEQMTEWVRHTNRYFTIVELTGDHFFINSRRPQLLSGIAAAIG